jgi:Ca2+-binding RTX toxin-like protein
MFPSTRIRSDEAGNDVIQGDSGNDQISGGSGNDILTEERTTELAVN